MHGFEQEDDAPLLLALFGKSDAALVTVAMELSRVWLHGFFDLIAASVDARLGAEIRDMTVTRQWSGLYAIHADTQKPELALTITVHDPCF